MIVGRTGNLTRDEIAEVIVIKCNLKKKEALDLVEEVFISMGAALSAGRDIQIRGFGSLVCSIAAQRNAANPRTGEKIVVPSYLKVRFKPAAALDARLNPARPGEPPTQPLFPEED